MSWHEEMKDLRTHVDAIDAEMVQLFQKRMDVSRQIARVKRDNNLAVQDSGREDEIVAQALQHTDATLKSETALLMRSIMTLSRAYQNRLLYSGETPMLPPPRAPLAGDVTCAYQGLPGAWSELAANRMFPGATLQQQAHFEDVFTAVKNGNAHYGVVPIENSKTGAIGETYDLLRKYGCYIVGRTWVSIRQNLVALPGATLQGIGEVLSHPEGLKQCRRTLQNHAWAQTSCRNTAVAAKTVAESGSLNKAAIASLRAAEIYGLQVLMPDIMDAADNRTSFVVIGSEPEYNEHSNLISATFSTQHRSGALCEALMPFVADSLNLMRIESRPATGGKYRFFVEIQGNIQDEKVRSALQYAASASEYFEVLGCYCCTDCEE